MVLNGAINIPSSQILYLIAGYFVAVGKLSFIPTIIVGTLGNTLGNFITYKLVYIYGKPIVKKLLYVKDDTLAKMHNEFENKGLWWLLVGKLVPSIKTLVPTIAGLSKIKFSHALAVFFAGSTVWSILVTYIGYTFGEQITFKGYTITMSIVGLIMVFIAYKKFIAKNNH